MVISISSTSTTIEFSIEIASPTLVMEYIVGYVPPKVGAGMETGQVLVIPKLSLQPDPPGSSMKKCSYTHKNKLVSTLMMEDEEAVVEICLPDDIPPKPSDTLMGRPTRMKSIHW